MWWQMMQLMYLSLYCSTIAMAGPTALVGLTRWSALFLLRSLNYFRLWNELIKLMGTCRVVGMGSKLIGCGSATPSLSVSNDDLSKIVETSDEWIAARTGIRNRRVLSGTSSSPYSIEFHDKLVSLASVVPPLCGCIINICGTSS